MSKIPLSIIIVNYNTGPLLEKCLKSLNNTITDIKYEIFVVDNNSSDSSRKIGNDLSNFTLIRNNKNVGFCMANNQALKIVRSDFILLLNPDTTLAQGAIGKMLDYLQSNRNVGIIGPRVLYPDGRPQQTAFSFPALLSILTSTLFLDRLFRKCRKFNKQNFGYRSHHHVSEVDAVSGCCLLMRKEVYDKIGELDERFFMYMEDIDFCRRAGQKNWRIIYFPRSTVYHDAGASSKENRYARVYFGRRSRVLYFRKYHGLLIILLVILLTFTEMVLRIPIEFMMYMIKKGEENKTRLKAYFGVIAFILNGARLPRSQKTTS